MFSDFKNEDKLFAKFFNGDQEAYQEIHDTYFPLAVCWMTGTLPGSIREKVKPQIGQRSEPWFIHLALEGEPDLLQTEFYQSDRII